MKLAKPRLFKKRRDFPSVARFSRRSLRSLSERIMLAAWAHEVGSSIGWIVGGGRESARELLGIPPGRVVRTAISLGYPDEGARRSRPGQARKPLDEIVNEERYGSRP